MGWVEGVSRVEEGQKKTTQSILRWNATIWQPKISVPALPSPGPTYQVASIHEPGVSRGSAGWKKDQNKKRNRYLGGMLPFGNPKIFVPALPPPGPTYQVASIHEPGGSRGSAGWKKDQQKKTQSIPWLNSSLWQTKILCP